MAEGFSISVKDKEGNLTPLEEQCIREHEEQGDVEQDLLIEKDIATQRLWQAFQESATAVAHLFRDCQQRAGLSTFHESASAVTQLYRDVKSIRSPSGQPEKFTSVFHGPIHKKQDKDVGGKKPSDRSWRLLYAAIQKHRMVFYSSVHDALANNPLTSEPPLDLHQCMVKVMPNGYKNRKNVFKLTSVLDGSECAIQSENEESMMTWMRIIHNLNRMMRIKMGPPQIGGGMTQPHIHHRNSTQEDSSKSQMDKKKIYRLLTPQPPSKKKSQDNKDDPSRRQQLLERLKRGKKKKDAVEDVDVPCYNTFGKPLEDCPASYENKSIPLIVMVCIKELEKHWVDTEGLYRIAGPIGQVRTLSHELNKGHFNLLQGHHDPHVITAVMKKFLKELPDPLVPLDKYNDFISCAQQKGVDPQEKKARMKELVDELPSCHYHTLGFLIKHLTNVAAHHQVSKMTQHNLAIVFGPTVAHKAGDDVVVGEMNASISIIELLMDNLTTFFSRVDFSAFRFESEFDSNIDNRSNRYPFLKGKSDPCSQYDGYGARSQSPRKSWDGTYMNSLSRGNLTVGSQETFLSSYDGGNTCSQDLRSRGPHKKRLATSRGKLAYIEEPQANQDLRSSKSTSTTTLPSPSPVTPDSAFSTVVSPKRKISYNNAVSKAWDPSSSDVLQIMSENSTSTNTRSSDLLQSVDENSISANTRKSSSSHTKFTFNVPRPTPPDRRISVGPVPSSYSASQRTTRHYKNYSDMHHRRWSAIDPPQPQGDIEIFGPTSSSNNEWLHRSKRLNGPESCL